MKSCGLAYRVAAPWPTVRGLRSGWIRLSGLEVAKVDGFAGTVSFAKAIGLLTSAKTQQTLENFERCADEGGDQVCGGVHRCFLG